MTSIGKILALLNLVVGLGFVSYGASIYNHRPTWFDKAPEVVDSGQSPLTFEGLKQEADTFSRAAANVSEIWVQDLKRLGDLEKRREDRLAVWKERSKWNREGNPNPPNAKDIRPGFFDVIDESAFERDALGKVTAHLDHTKLGPAIKVNGVALRGADTLKTSYDKDVTALNELQKQIEAQQKEFDRLGLAILAEEGRLLKMSDIRASVQAELFYLASFEVNVYETRETVFRRKQQLDRRLAELSGGN